MSKMAMKEVRGIGEGRDGGDNNSNGTIGGGRDRTNGDGDNKQMGGTTMETIIFTDREGNIRVLGR